MKILQSIHGHDDLVRLTDGERQTLCEEIRTFLVEHVSKTGGHLASNLGVVELSVALETVFDTYRDRLVFDVGHQSYIHKLLTGRQADFEHLRQFGGMAGFPKPGESDADAFVAGHASSSVSIALGMARARTLRGQNHSVIALMGDGAATGGMVYEGLNDAAVSQEPMILILNDNAMSIDRNVGGMARHLSHLRTKESYLGAKEWYRAAMLKTAPGTKIYNGTRKIKDWVKRIVLPTTIFENMGFTYLGPVDGHDLPNLIMLLRIARDMRRPVLLHVLTQKGRGYAPAQEDPSKFHGIGRFDPETGNTGCKRLATFSDAFGGQMVELAKDNEKVCAITAAMPSGTGLTKFKQTFPRRFFDVGIAEEHAVSMAGGLAKEGMIPVVAIYSTFLQRAYDQIQQDISILNLHTVLAVDRAGLVGEDGETHHGVYDVGFLRQMPNMRLLAPVSLHEARDMLVWAVNDQSGPVAIRYPRGGDRCYAGSDWAQGPVKCHRQGGDVTLITYGTILENVLDAAERLRALGVEATVLRLLELTNLPIEEIARQIPRDHPVVLVEEICEGSGIKGELGMALTRRCPQCRFTARDLGHRFVTHGDMKSLYRHYGLDGASIAEYVREVLANEE